MDALIQDLRYAVRTLLKTPGFTIVAVLTLALGIGANTTIFSVVNAVVLRQLPYEDPGALVRIQERIAEASASPITVSAPDVLQLRQRAHTLVGVAGFEALSFDLAAGDGAPERVKAARISANLFQLLGISPLYGRYITDDEDRVGRPVALLSYGTWRDRFGADRAIVGKTVRLSRVPYTVIGVMPPEAEFPQPGLSAGRPAELFVPMAFTPQELAQVGDNFNVSVLARLKRGVSLAQANADLAAAARRIRETYPITRSFTLEVLASPLRDAMVGPVKTPLLLLLGAVIVVLLIACANLANLMLSRAVSRARELAVRAALGAGRWRLARQLLTESCVLALTGGLLGALLAADATGFVLRNVPQSIPLAGRAGMDWRVLAFTVVVSFGVGLLFGVAPVFSVARADLHGSLKEGGRSATLGGRRNRLRAGLAVAQLALAMLLLTGAGLLIRSFARVIDVDPGFHAPQALTMTIALPSVDYATADRTDRFWSQLTERLAVLPGVKAVGMATDLPLLGNWIHIFTAEGHTAPAKLQRNGHSVVGGDYFRALGIPLRAGRFFTERDREGAPGVVIISEGMAHQYWPGEDPIGKRLKWGMAESPSPWLTIVGVVGDVKQRSLEVQTLAQTYEPLAQSGAVARAALGSALNVIVLADHSSALPAAVRSEVRALDPGVAVASLQTMGDVVSSSVAPRRFGTSMMLVFAAAALAISSLGIYGVLAFMVGQRRHEIGIRLALGATPVDVHRLVLGQGARLIVVGLVLGLIAAGLLTQAASGLLYGVTASDPISFFGALALLGVIATLACYLPARRAARVDPIVALRSE